MYMYVDVEKLTLLYIAAGVIFANKLHKILL